MFMDSVNWLRKVGMRFGTPVKKCGERESKRIKIQKIKRLEDGDEKHSDQCNT